MEAALQSGISLRKRPPAMVPVISQQAVAFIAHDALKSAMADFAFRHFDLLSQTRERFATGTTGTQLNEMAWSRGWPRDRPWVQPLRSGPLGGDLAPFAHAFAETAPGRLVWASDWPPREAPSTAAVTSRWWSRSAPLMVEKSLTDFEPGFRTKRFSIRFL